MNEELGFNLLWAIGALALVGSSLIARRMPIGQTFKMALAWVAIFAGIFVLFALRDDFGAIWNKVKVAALGQQAEQGGAIMRIAMAEDGHFWVDAGVNGRSVRFLVDSGATTTSLSAETARAAGVEVDNSGFSMLVETANGTIEARRSRIDTLTLGSITRRDLSASVSPGLADDTNLLGMNFLSSLKSWRVEGRTLVLEP